MRHQVLPQALALLAIASLLTTGCGRSGEPNPSASSGKPESQQASGGAEFVGNARCAECHAEQSAAYASTGHASTFALTQDSSASQALDGTTFRDPERDVTYHYHFDAGEGLSVTIPELFGEDSFPLRYAVGSNQHALTFVSLIPDLARGTAGIEHRVSVYGKEQRLDLTPGHRGEIAHEEVQMFGKVLPPDTLKACIGCHTTSAAIAGTEVVDLRPNVGCESCHGPGSRHVAAMEAGGVEALIQSLRPADAAAALQQVEVCGKCHRMPGDIAPDDLHAGNPKLARFQPVGLLKSRCFEESDGRLSCSTCHDPHARPAHQRENFVDACLKCHSDPQSRHSVCPVSPRQDCIRCHMPPTEVHPGIHFHDHWIRVR